MRGPVRVVLSIAVLMPVLASRPALAQNAQTSQPADSREPISARRIIKHFDFNERPLGNLDTEPMDWRPLRQPGFPQYLQGRFDNQVGHASVPSFRLDLDGGSLAYRYEGNDIAVRPNSDYLVVAWVKTSGLRAARAYLTVYFLDRKGNRLPNTERSTALIGGSGKPEEWQPIQVGLIGDVADARYMGLTIWLAQQSVWDQRPRAMHAIERDDVKVAAWFDDLTIYRLPRVALRSESAGNVFSEDEPVVLHPEITDPDGLNLSATLWVNSVDGHFHDHRSVPIRTGSAGSMPVVYDNLPVGLYEVTLIASTQDVPLVHRHLRFARLPKSLNPPQSVGRGFGIVLDDTEVPAIKGQWALLDHLRPELVKLPVWYTQRAVLHRSLETTQAVDGYLQAIVESGGNPVGVHMDDPHDANAAPGSLRSMIDLMSEDPVSWKPFVAGTWSRYAGLIHIWQFGEDGEDAFCLDHRVPGLLATLRREMASLMGEPLLATTVPITYPPGTGTAADYRVFKVPCAVRPECIAEHVLPLVGKNAERAWISLDTLSYTGYPREARLADYAQRITEAYFLNTGAVFVNSPWEAQIDMVTAQVSPNEEYLVLRTLCDVLGNTVPVSRTNIDGQAECMVFDRNGQAMLFAWDNYAPPEGREHLLYLGEFAEQIDLFGRRTPLESIGQLQRVVIGRMPTFIVNTPTWLCEFRRQFTVDPPLLEASFSYEPRNIVFKNTWREPISGVLRLVTPENWDVRPTRMAFALQPGQVFRQPIDIRFPINAEAGVKAFLGEFDIDADRRYQLSVPAWFDLGLNKIDLDTYAFRRGPDAIIRVSVTNRTDASISFDGDIVIPGRQRLSRLFQSVLPGQSVTKEFVLEKVGDLAGRYVRVHFNERQGSRVWNRLITVP